MGPRETAFGKDQGVLAWKTREEEEEGAPRLKQGRWTIMLKQRDRGKE